METVLEILKYTLPAFIVFLTAYFSIRQIIKNTEQIRKTELILGNQKIITPIKLQAYERLVLLLERLSPDSLIMRVSKLDMTSKQLHTTLLSTIRSEFEHNLSQQVYVSPKTWSVIKGAKENLVKIINNAAEKIDADKPGILLSKSILDYLMPLAKPPTQIAIDFMKEEIQVLM